MPPAHEAGGPALRKPRSEGFRSMPIATARHFAPALIAALAASASVAATAPVAAKAPPPASAPHGYDLPQKNILDVLHAPEAPSANLSPTRQTMLLVTMQPFPPIA